MALNTMSADMYSPLNYMELCPYIFFYSWIQSSWEQVFKVTFVVSFIRELVAQNTYDQHKYKRLLS
jgi:hypothetical protein